MSKPLMQSKGKRIAFRILKVSGIAIASILFLMFLLPYLFPDFVATKIKQWARNSVHTELNFSRARLSFFNHFPSLTLTLYDFSVNGAKPFEQEVLVQSDEIALGVDLFSVFSPELNIDKIFLDNAFINIQVDAQGQANYNIYQSSDTTTTSNDSSAASLKMERIEIANSHLVYKDASLPMLLEARGLNYRGTGDLSQAVFDLNTHMRVDSLDFYYDDQPYFQSKKINADLVTRINTSSLALVFERNRVLINQLPVEFNGSFEFLSDGYKVDFRLRSANSNLHDMFTALPPDVLQWLDKTDVKGYGNLDATFRGTYQAATGAQPDFALNLHIRDGYISNKQAPVPLENIQLDLQAKLPQLDMEQLWVRLDSLSMRLDKDFVDGSLLWKGWSQPEIHTQLNAALDMERWSKTMGLSAYELKGRYAMHLQANGRYATKVVPVGLRKQDTVIASIPQFELRSSLTDGYCKVAGLPQGVENINFNLTASCADSIYTHTKLAVENLRATVMDNFIKGYVRLANTADFPIDARLETVLDLAKIQQFYPLDSTHLGGHLKIDITSKGNYVPDKKQFPVTEALLELKDGSIKTPYYPQPIEQIQVTAAVKSRQGSLKDLQVNCTPVSFRFEGQPFMIRANLQDFDNLRYNIASRGVLDLGKLYKVFAIKGYDLEGFIETNLALQGLQSDATQGKLDRLHNSGTMKLRNLVFRSDLFPQPFLIKDGLFRFEQDKMWLKNLDLNYGKSNLRLNGYLYNLVSYMTDRKAPLKGAFDLTSDYVLADEFTAFAEASSGTTPDAAVTGSGVFMVPSDLSLQLKTLIKRTRFNGMDIDSLQGSLSIDSGLFKMEQAGFILIGMPVVMDARYEATSPLSASFDYTIKAKDFDIKRAYNEIRLFHDMASAASKAEGLVSLDYHLAGRLDQDMNLVYPSLTGGGELTLKKVKVKGLKMFNEASRKTGKDISDPDLKAAVLKTTIAKNVITLQRTKMKVSAFKLRMEGQADFNGRLNMGLRIGLPPFGVIGIPLKITGTQDNPQIKVGKMDKDPLEETEDRPAVDSTVVPKAGIQ